MSLTNAQFEHEFIKALLSDPYNPEGAVILRLDLKDWTTGNRGIAEYLKLAYENHGCLDAGAFVELAKDREMDQSVRFQIMDLIGQTVDVPFPLARMAEKMVRLKSEALSRARMEKALNGPSEALESTLKEALSILETGSALSEAPTLAQEWANLRAGIPLQNERQRTAKLRFGLPVIDKVIQTGPGNLGVIAAKPSAGKSSLALQAAIRSARAGIQTMFLGLEMPRVELAARAIAWETGSNSFDLLQGHVPDCSHTPDWINNLSVYERIPKGAFDEACTMIRKAAKSGVETVIVDYWTLICPPETKVKGSSSAYLLGEMSRGFKQLAKDTGTHIVLVSQFNREAKDAERPGLENLRETGQLEQDASWVLMMWTEQKEYGPYDNRGVWVELMKNRGGPRWVKVYTSFNPTTGKFCEAEPPKAVQGKSIKEIIERTK